MISFLRWKRSRSSGSAVVIVDVWLVKVLIIANYINIYITAISKSAEKMMMQIKLAIT